MKTETIFAGAIGFLMGRATAPAPEPLGYWDFDPALGCSRGAYEGAPKKPAEPQLEAYPGDAELRRRLWAPYEPATAGQWARREDGSPWFPRFGRRWAEGYRADYLYYVPAGEVIRFPQPGEGEAVREGAGWILVRDEPGWGWSVSEAMSVAQMEKLLAAVVKPNFELAKKTLKQWPWGKGKPEAIPESELALPEWWDGLGAEDPRYLFPSIHLLQHGFMPRTLPTEL